MLIQNREITHPDVTLLIRRAEDELLELYPDMGVSPVDPHARFVVAYVMGQPVGCGALAPVSSGEAVRLSGAGIDREAFDASGCLGNTVDGATVEIKRMYVIPAHRRTGVARRILAALIRRAKDQLFGQVILETGTRQRAAIALYETAGFERTEPYGEYIDNPYSVCFVKKL